MQANVDNLQTAVWIYNIDNPSILWANPAALKLWNSDSLEELTRRNFSQGQSSAVKESLFQYQQAFKRGEVIQENWSFSPKGIDTQAFCQFSGIVLEDGSMGMLVEANTATKHLGSTTILSIYSSDGHFISGNPAFTKIFGSEPLNLNHLAVDSEVIATLCASLLQGIRFEEDVLLQTPQGPHWFRVIADRATQDHSAQTFLLHLYDINERKTIEESLRKQAWTDPLTGLLNRRGLIHSLEKNFESKDPFTLFYIDLDGFKMVNDSLGHGLGDDVLIEVCNRLQRECLQGEELCRFGGDEFILISHEDTSAEESATRCRQLLDRLSKKYQTLQGRSLSITASIGLSHFPKDGSDIERIITCGDAAMYQAKKMGKKCWVTYRDGMELTLKRSSLLAQKLAVIDKDKMLDLHYQPIVNVATNQIVSFEALLRWDDEELGYINPEELIRIAEETGLIYSVENWVLHRAAKSLKVLRKLTNPNVTMSVNISGLHFSAANFENNILSVLDKYDLQPSDLVIELTESVLLSDISSQSSPIKSLRRSKIELSIDDFGTGFSSLAYLHNIPAATVKVDKSFLDNMFLDNMELNTVTLECIHKLIDALNMDSLIEGVETKRQMDVLSALGYNLQQGYYHGKPKPLEYYVNLSATQ